MWVDTWKQNMCHAPLTINLNSLQFTYSIHANAKLHLSGTVSQKLWLQLMEEVSKCVRFVYSFTPDASLNE